VLNSTLQFSPIADSKKWMGAILEEGGPHSSTRPKGELRNWRGFVELQLTSNVTVGLQCRRRLVVRSS
jgi:hypothetical protein